MTDLQLIGILTIMILSFNGGIVAASFPSTATIDYLGKFFVVAFIFVAMADALLIIKFILSLI